MIISVGYRVNSKKGILFRKWASNILKNYLVEGYVVNEKRLSYLEKQINLISIASRLDERLISDEGNNNWFNDEFFNYVIILGKLRLWC